MKHHVLIVGGGVIGLCSAYYSARAGHRVTVVERHAAQRDGCSFGNAGLVVPSHFVPLAAPGIVGMALRWMGNPESPFYVKPRLDWDLFSWGWKFMRAATAAHVRRCAPLLRDSNLASRACFEELAALPGEDFGFVKKGLLMLCKTPQTLDKEARFAAHARELGVTAEMLDASQAAALEPAVRLDVAGAVFFPQDCHLSPHRFMANIQQQVEKLGVTFLWDTEVSGLAQEGSRLRALQTSRGDLDADEFVLAGGAWSPQLTRSLGLKLPMQAGKGYSLTLPKPRQLPVLSAILTEARIAVTPMQGALRFGGTMEIAGLNENINPARVRGLIKAVPRYYPEFSARDFEGIPPWRGLRPCSPDGLPYVGRTGRASNLILATGHAMMGLSLGPITGRLVAGIVSGVEPEFDLTLLHPDRHG